MIPQVLDTPPEYPLELTYRTIRTYPGMRLTTDATRFNPMMHWPAEPGAFYTIIISNLDINSRKNRCVFSVFLLRIAIQEKGEIQQTHSVSPIGHWLSFGTGLWPTYPATVLVKARRFSRFGH